MLNPLSNLAVNLDSAKQVVSKDSSIHQFRLMSTFYLPQSWITLRLVMNLTSILGHHTPKHEFIGLFFPPVISWELRTSSFSDPLKK